mmetsp:Transcript_2936/g.9206  ORF Transcript_2936/g.9206 Transcript_2936/m.9206 type:complete len:603 (+) Transcript_2936:173-1981(+)
MSETTVSKSQMLTVLRDDHRLLREAFEEERQQNAALKNWIKDQLRPGIRTLKDSLYQRVAELEAELAEERKKREQMWHWVQTHLGQDLKKLESVIDQRVRAQQPASSSQGSHTNSSSSVSPWSVSSAHSASAQSSTNHSSTHGTNSTPVKSSGAPRQRQQQRISRSQTSEEEDEPESPVPQESSTRRGGSSAGAGTGGLASNPFMQHSAANRSSGGSSSNRFVQPVSSGGSSNRFVVSHASSNSTSNTSGSSSVTPSSSSHSSSAASFAEVRDWLTKQSMERYAENFESHGYTSLSKVATMTKTDLSSAGIKLLGHKKALLLAIEELQQSTSTTKVLSTSGSSHSRAAPVAVDEDAAFWGDSPKVAASPQPRRSRPKTTYASSSSMSSSSSSIDDAVHQVKNDHIATNWALFQYEPKSNSVGVDCQGEGGYNEFLSNLSEAKVQWGLLRVEDGDRESRRVKFVFVTWCGPSTNGIVKARSNTHKRDVVRSVGQFHIEIFAEDLGDLDMSNIQKQLKKAGGADYDTGSNKSGYTSQAKSIREKALANLRRTDDPNSASAFVFEKHALPNSTPCDLSGRKFVAPPSEAQANIDLAGGLDVSKWQ